MSDYVGSLSELDSIVKYIVPVITLSGEALPGSTQDPKINTNTNNTNTNGQRNKEINKRNSLMVELLSNDNVVAIKKLPTNKNLQLYAQHVFVNTMCDNGNGTHPPNPSTNNDNPHKL
eukprot:gnl/Chilomastix_caulleri/2480.p1 GENE.gnl/Chilomastix_caulleri/2480~~gnl/Chilomastix_caulleri/2480.p1  ORF type:complete len:118 (+),score=37.33 gnl/Chilomastix_caulleri/2480:60-413(+)